jgi:hypothetical protein
MSDPAPDLLDDIALQAFAGTRAGAGTRSDIPLVMEYSRDLTREDIEVLNNVPVNAPAPVLKALRYSHHMLARLLAAGKAPAEAACFTGHSVATIYRLKTQDPAFMELIAHYAEVRNQEFLEAASRLAVLGTSVVEVLQERVEEAPEKITTRELKEIAEFAFDRSVAPAKGSARGANGAAAGVTVNVSFVSPRAPGGEEAPLIEVTTTPQLEPPK